MRFYFFALLQTSHRSPLSERLQQANETKLPRVGGDKTKEDILTWDGTGRHWGRLRAVSFFSLQSYYKQNLSTRAAKKGRKPKKKEKEKKKKETADSFVLSGDNEAVKVI